MANHLYYSVDAYPPKTKAEDKVFRTEDQFSSSVEDFIKLNKLPFRTHGYENHHGSTIITNITGYYEDRKGGVLQGMRWTHRDLTTLAAQLPEGSTVKVTVHVECNDTTEDIYIISRSGEMELVASITHDPQPYDTSLHTPEGYKVEHEWELTKEEKVARDKRSAYYNVKALFKSFREFKYFFREQSAKDKERDANPPF